MMTLYSGTTCPFSHRCRIVLFEKGMDFLRRVPRPREVNHVVSCLDIHSKANSKRRENNHTKAVALLERLDPLLPTIGGFR
jgi:RNA polymerase-associated protein